MNGNLLEIMNTKKLWLCIPTKSGLLLSIAVIALFNLNSKIYSQGVSINATGAVPNASAMLDIDAAGKGLLIPRMTTAQRPASPITSLIIYNTTLAWFEYWNGTAWVPFLSSSTGWTTFGNTLTGTLPASPAEWIGTINATDWIVKTNNTERLRVNASGNVGVGTTNPLSKIQISSDINIGKEWGDLLAITQISNDLGEIQNIADGGAGGFTMTNGNVLTTSACGGHRLLVGYISLPAGKYQISIQNRATTTATLCNGGGNGPNMMRISVWLVNGGTLSTDPIVATADSPSPVNTSKVVYTTNGPIATIAAGTYGIWIVVNQFLGEYNGYLLSAKIHKVE